MCCCRVLKYYLLIHLLIIVVVILCDKVHEEPNCDIWRIFALYPNQKKKNRGYLNVLVIIIPVSLLCNLVIITHFTLLILFLDPLSLIWYLPARLFITFLFSRFVSSFMHNIV